MAVAITVVAGSSLFFSTALAEGNNNGNDSTPTATSTPEPTATSAPIQTGTVTAHMIEEAKRHARAHAMRASRFPIPNPEFHEEDFDPVVVDVETARLLAKPAAPPTLDWSEFPPPEGTVGYRIWRQVEYRTLDVSM